MTSAAATPIPSPSWWPTGWPRSATILSALHLLSMPLAITLALSTPGFAQTQGPGWADRTEPLDEVGRFFVASDALFSKFPFKPEGEAVR